MSDNPFPVRPTPELTRQAGEPSGATAPVSTSTSGGFPSQPSAPSHPAREEQPKPTGFLRQQEDEVEDVEEAPVPTSHHQAPVSPGPKEVSSAEGPPPLQMDEKSCRTCTYFDFPGNMREKVEGGECRRSAPSISGGKKAAWPAVDWNAWCGEWELGVSDDDMVRMARDVADRCRARSES